VAPDTDADNVEVTLPQFEEGEADGDGVAGVYEPDVSTTHAEAEPSQQSHGGQEHEAYSEQWWTQHQS